MSYTMAPPELGASVATSRARRSANKTLTDQSSISREFLELSVGNRLSAVEQAHGESAAGAGNGRRAFAGRLGRGDRRREHRDDSAQARRRHHRRLWHGGPVPASERTAQ